MSSSELLLASLTKVLATCRSDAAAIAALSRRTGCAASIARELRDLASHLEGHLAPGAGRLGDRKWSTLQIPENSTQASAMIAASHEEDPVWAPSRLLAQHGYDDIGQYLRATAPPLDGLSHKGQQGRIGVLGGSIDYAGGGSGERWRERGRQGGGGRTGGRKGEEERREGRGGVRVVVRVGIS
jgi:hypothetical protein